MINRNKGLSVLLIALSCFSAIAAVLSMVVRLQPALRLSVTVTVVLALLSDALFISGRLKPESYASRTVRCQDDVGMRSLKALYDRIDESMRTKKNYLYEDFTLGDLASTVYSNKSKVSRAINTFTGQNFCQYLNKLRLEYAVDLMKRDPHMKTSEVASMSGFHSNGTFHKTFKMYMDGTPSEYMRKVRIRSRHLSMKQERERLQ